VGGTLDNYSVDQSGGEGSISYEISSLILDIEEFGSLPGEVDTTSSDTVTVRLGNDDSVLRLDLVL
jgi:hypothetical protein